MRALAIRPMSDGDLLEIITIERRSQSPPWSGDSFLREIRNTSGYGFVAHNDHRILNAIVTILPDIVISTHHRFEPLLKPPVPFMA